MREMVGLVKGIISHAESHELNDILEGADKRTDVSQYANHVVDASHICWGLSHWQNPVLLPFLQFYLNVCASDVL